MRRLFATALLLWVTSVSFACNSDSGTTQIMGPGAVPADLRTLVDVTTGLDITTGETGTFNFAGQSFVVPESGTFGDLRFNFYTFQKTPVAFGNLYLLSQEYLGLPGALSSVTPGFVARSESISDNVYAFNTSAVITGGTKYWVYTDAQGSFAGSFDTDIYTGGDLYVTGIASAPFRKALASGRMVGGVFVPAPPGVFVDANFKLQARSR